MKRFLIICTLFCTLFVCAQNEQLAQNYYDKGDFEKALISYESLLKTQNGNSFFFKERLNVTSN